MKTGKKYTVIDNEGFEEGSNNTVLKNLLGITSKDEIDNIEEVALAKTYRKVIAKYNEDHKFVAEDIKELHAIWLGEIYPFAGQYRTVNMSKGGFPFAAANQIPSLMTTFETELLTKYTPCNFSDLSEIVQALAIIHAELILIHPFREGNGRLARLLSTLMGLQANLPILNFGIIKDNKVNDYIFAVQASLDEDYSYMENIFKLVVNNSAEDAD